MSARVIEVIEVEEARGQGTSQDPCRIVRTYYTLKGKWLAEHDPYREPGTATTPEAQ